MSRDYKKIVEDNKPYAIQNKYFEDLKDPFGCRVCAIGALIRELPVQSMNVCYKEISSVGKDAPDHNRTGISCLKETPLILTEYYDIDIETLEMIQFANDWESEISK